MSDRIVGGINLTGYKLSRKAQQVIDAWREAEQRAIAYRRENAEYIPQYSRSWGGKRVGGDTPALVRAERELKQLDALAVAEGKPLTDRDAYLAPVLAKAEEVARTLPLLDKAAEDRRQEAESAVFNELPALATQALENARKAKANHDKAYEAFLSAQAALKASVDRITNVITMGQVDSAWIRGLNRNGDEYAGVLEFTEDGKLTYKSAWNLHFVGGVAMNVDMVDLGGLVDLDG
ncbi:hypothetical protein [Streptomyces mexicanus]|uniref:Uncharacterized protein n=1 Tax=Streptomyces mexicanus TaxID=178566 RepID=A0A7X1I2W8_9ACTN|nr:hypothetical protein [Streptomyces mexicanus]MBC2867471.1 hypothetical protein [Streptomyces mexicanus]